MRRRSIDVLKEITFSRPRAPTPDDDSTKDYVPGCNWVDTSVTPNIQYVCTGNTPGAAVWTLINVTGLGEINTVSTIGTIGGTLIWAEV